MEGASSDQRRTEAEVAKGEDGCPVVALPSCHRTARTASSATGSEDSAMAAASGSCGGLSQMAVLGSRGREEEQGQEPAWMRRDLTGVLGCEG